MSVPKILIISTILLILAPIFTACITPGMTIIPISAASQPTYTPRPPLVTVPPDATATATPFQPLPPTAVYYPTDISTATPTATPKSQPPEPEAPIASFERPPDQINILLLGTDQRPWSANFRTDTIILLTLNPSLGTVSLTSFPRDLYVFIPGFTYERINTAFYRGGFGMIASTFQYNFGVRPDRYILVHKNSFKRAIDTLGGLDVNVGVALSDYRRGYGYVTIPTGINPMDADTVLWYARSRKTTNDFARTRRQQEVLLAIGTKFLSLNAIKRVPELYQIYNQSVTTDMTLGDILPLLPLAAQLTDTSRIHHYFIGPKQTYDWITPGGGMVLLPRQAAITKVLRQALGGQ